MTDELLWKIRRKIIKEFKSVKRADKLDDHKIMVLNKIAEMID